MSDPRRALRQRLRAERAALPPSARIAAAEAVAARLLTMPELQSSGYVAGYWAINGEVPLHALQSRLPDSIVYCLPKLGNDGSLRFAPWHTGDALITNRFGIPEPDSAQSATLAPHELLLALVPLLGFDRRGQRLGTGGGWYDRSFAFRRTTAAPPQLIGVGYALQELVDIDASHWDVPMDAIVTDRELIECGH